MDRIIALLDEMFASGVGSAGAVSLGDQGEEIERLVRGHTRRLPTIGAEIDDHTWFDVASLTKPMATVGSAMVLVGDGALDLDDPIRRWLPGAASTGTVRQLLGHAAGCAAHVEFFRTLSVGDRPDPRAELAALATTNPASPPGVTAVYSDLGYIMLGAIVERAAGVPLEQAVADLVMGPLGLGARFVDTTSVIGGASATGGSPTSGTGGANGPRIGVTTTSGTSVTSGLRIGVANTAATELDERTGVPAVMQGRVHDENAYFGGGVCGHAGLFARLDDVCGFARAIVDTAAGHPRGRLRTDVVNTFLSAGAAPGASWRLGWDTPSATPGVSHAGDRWPRANAVGHLGFTGTSMWLDLERRRWAVILTNRVHPTRAGASAEAIKKLRRGVNDAAIDILDGA